ncbi:DsrE family protein [Lapidilactobacillus mulanensis]|uniref:DsrE family protein n=1 Tax=Lapidilactobacillus mulanensis TaxID=2485999 RepID=A0ABW4DMK3_9LACO|nr:DsrE family protein [Lapidilactobacillus mulanensis]
MLRKVVFHVDELEKWGHTLSNVHNLLNYQREHAELQLAIVVLVNGDAIMGYLQPNYREEIATLKDQAIFHACNNSLKSHGVKPDRLPPEVQVVPVGVLDLIELQDENYRYIKP